MAGKRRQVAPLPFELVVLEVALGDVCTVLARLARELDSAAGPTLEALTRDVPRPSLPPPTPTQPCHASTRPLRRGAPRLG